MRKKDCSVVEQSTGLFHSSRGRPAHCGPTAAKRASALFVVHVFEQEAGVLELFGLGLGLTQGVEAHARDDQDRGAAERQLGVEAEGMISTVGIRATNSR